jgi:hypothetical protein
MGEEGVDLVAIDDHTVRAVTHLDVDFEGIARAIATASRVLDRRS